MSAASVESQVRSFFAKYTPAIEAQLHEARRRLRAMFPRGFELVFDNYNAVVCGFSPTERNTDAFISIAGYPKWVTLFFLHGIELDDPQGLLEGAGKQIRSIRLKTPDDIAAPAVAALIAQAIRPYEQALRDAPALTTSIKMIVAKQRPRRPAPVAIRR
jgi:hypothetical protein